MTDRGEWIQTYSGQQFFPLEPKAEEVHAEDIAHALGLLCRFGGHSVRFYSVAEHCVLMSYLVPPEDALWALLHDATEAYVVDLPRPIKRMLPDYSAMEGRVMDVILEAFDLTTPMMPDSVREADNRILFTERDQLMRPSGIAWSAEGIWMPYKSVTVEGWSPTRAEDEYLTRLVDLLTVQAQT